MSTRQTRIIRRNGDEEVEARLYVGMDPSGLLLVERSWIDARNDVLRRHVELSRPREELPESLHWNWGEKAPWLKRLEATGYGIECDEKWQGVMLTTTALRTARLEGEEGKPLVYIDFVESAPWNWHLPNHGLPGEFRGVGALLFRTAVEQSFDEGFHGRVGLHSLPQSDGFYRQGLGMTALGRDRRKQDLTYFELSRERARELLEGGN